MSEIKITKDSIENGILKDGKLVVGTAGQSMNCNIVSNGNGAVAIGRTQGIKGTIKSEYSGAVAAGKTNGDNSLIYAQGPGVIAYGKTYGNNSSISAYYSGAFAHGNTNDENSGIIAMGAGAIAYGKTDSQNSHIIANADGATACGKTEGIDSSIIAYGTGSLAYGKSQNNNSYIIAHGEGSTAHGRTKGSGSYIEANNAASYAHGSTDGANSYIKANGIGAEAAGIVLGSGTYIESSGQYDAAYARGRADNGYIKASGPGAHAEGYANSYTIKASGSGAVAMGYAVSRYLDASGAGAIATGYDVQAIGDGTNAEGIRTIANKMAAHAEGYDTSALGTAAHAEGYYTIADSSAAHAEGYYTKAIGDYSHAEGQCTITYGSGSHAEGFGDSNAVTTNDSYAWTKDSSIILCYGGTDSFVANKLINIVLIIDNEYYTIENYPVSTFSIKIKLNKNVTAESGTNKIKYLKYGAIGAASHVEGQKTLALGNYSHAGGEGTIASGTASIAIGKYNRIDTTNPTGQLFTIGNGSSDTDRKNLFTLYDNGLIEYSKLIVDNTVINQDYGSYIWYDHSEQANAPALLIKKYYRYIIIKNRPSNDKNLQNIYLDRDIISRYDSNEYTIPISILNLTDENIKFRFILDNASALTYIDIRPCEFYHATLYKSQFKQITFYTAPASYESFAVLYKYYNNWSSDQTTLTVVSLTTPSSGEYEVVNTNKVIIKKYFRYIDVGCACDIAFSGDVFTNGHKIVSVCSAFSSDTVNVYYNANAIVDLTNGQYVTLISSSATFTFNTKTCTKMFRPDIG